MQEGWRLFTMTINHRVLGWDYIGSELKNLSLFYCFIIWDNQYMSHLDRSLSVSGASGHDLSDISKEKVNSNTSTSRKNSEAFLLKQQGTLFQDQSNYYKTKVNNENRESKAKDIAMQLNSMQTNLAFMDDLIKKTTNEDTKVKLQAQYENFMNAYVKFATDNLTT